MTSDPQVNFADPDQVSRFVEAGTFGIVEILVVKTPPVFETPIGWLSPKQVFEDPMRTVYIKVAPPEGVTPPTGKCLCVRVEDWVSEWLSNDAVARPVLKARFTAQCHEETK